MWSDSYETSAVATKIWGVDGSRQMRISCNLLIIYASLAQWKEQEISNLLVEGSNPSGCARLDD